MKRLTSLLSTAALLAGLACASYTDVARAADAPREVAAEEAATGEPWDPIEPFNRVMFGINEYMMLLLVAPFAGPYRGTAPDVVRESVDNFFANLREPVDLLNELLQGEWLRAWVTVRRFVVNSTIGVGGLIDMATDMGLEGHKEDFGQTLAVWGVPEGFYIVLPAIGPIYPRDGVGKLVDSYADPWPYVTPEEFPWGVRIGKGVHEYAEFMPELDKIRQTSVDYYAAIRSMYTQKRRADIVNGDTSAIPVLPDISSYEDPAAKPNDTAREPEPREAVPADKPRVIETIPVDKPTAALQPAGEPPLLAAIPEPAAWPDTGLGAVASAAPAPVARPIPATIAEALAN